MNAEIPFRAALSQQRAPHSRHAFREATNQLTAGDSRCRIRPRAAMQMLSMGCILTQMSRRFTNLKYGNKRRKFLRLASPTTLTECPTAAGEEVISDKQTVSRREITSAMLLGFSATSSIVVKAEEDIDLQGVSFAWSRMEGAPTEAAVFSGIESDSQWSLDFIIYLSRILLNYDEASSRWWEKEILPKVEASIDHKLPESTQLAVRAAKLRDQFADFAASVEYGLRRYGKEGRRKFGVLKKLLERYGQSLEQRQQLALAFTLLEDQPLELLASILESLAPQDRLQAAFSPALSDYLAMDPKRLLPTTQFPVWDGGQMRWVIPGLRAAQPYRSAFDEVERGSVMSVFGARGNGLVIKERPLCLNDYGLFAISGALGCALTHSLVIPLDVVKTRLQSKPGRYGGLISGAIEIQQTEGTGALFLGWQPTVLGYLWYGITVYPGYEFFKRLFLSLAGPVIVESFRVPLVLLAGAAATVFACFGVCPAEACRIRMVADRRFQNASIFEVARTMTEEDGPAVFFDGLSTILVRQVLFGMMKFLVFDYFADFVFDLFPIMAETFESQLAVSVLSGAIAGVVSSIVSQPADAIFTRMNQKGGRSSFVEVAEDIFAKQGVGGFFTGLGSRCVWAGCIISGQFFLYDVCKSFLGVKDLRMFLDVQV